MFRKFKYGIVAMAGILVVLVVAGVTGFRTKNTTEDMTDAEAVSFGVSDFVYNHQGNNSAHVNEFGVSYYDPETTTDGADFRLEKSPSVAEGESLSAAGKESSETEESVQEENYFGLRAYFKNKLIIDTEKVELYLNVREEPDNDSKILSVLFANDVVTYTEKVGHWYAIECDGYIGYVSADYVLTDMDVYNELADSVAYAVMVENSEAMLYEKPDNTGVPILAGQKGEAFRTVGMSGDYYQVHVISDVYDTLYVHKDEVLLYYLFLGRGNDNEMGEAYEAYFGSLEIADNLKKSIAIKEQAEEEWAQYESYLASSEEESRSLESSYEAASIASREAAEQAYRESLQAAASQAAASGQARYIGRMMITHYCHCQKCCGIWGSNDPNYAAHGSSGMKLVSGYTVSVNTAQIPYGTRLLINGKEYIAADDGAACGVVDIYMQTHDQALASGCYTADVYILP